MSPSKRLIQALWGAAVIYLPLIIMATLALATYWLYRNTPITNLASSEQAPTHDPDYFMKDFALRTLDAQGRLKSEVHGQVLHHYPDTDTLEIDRVRMYAMDSQNQQTTASATKALSNADGSQVQLIGQAQVLRPAFVNDKGQSLPALSLQSEFLHVYVNTERVKSHKPVLLIRGSDRIEAASLDFSYLDRTSAFDGRVSAQFGGKQKP